MKAIVAVAGATLLLFACGSQPAATTPVAGDALPQVESLAQPTYPESARKAGMEGTAVVEVTLSADLLAPEVIDEQDASIGFYLKRCFVEFVGVVVYKIEACQGKFTTDHNHRPFDMHPARIRDDTRSLLYRPALFG